MQIFFVRNSTAVGDVVICGQRSDRDLREDLTDRGIVAEQLPPAAWLGHQAESGENQLSDSYRRDQGEIDSAGIDAGLKSDRGRIGEIQRREYTPVELFVRAVAEMSSGTGDR